jgi:hypothetical protein
MPYNMDLTLLLYSYNLALHIHGLHFQWMHANNSMKNAALM